tara:strand:+ start:784 stop:927 length:144 start_codon:yes stop_codon:yes gene_type:complete
MDFAKELVGEAYGGMEKVNAGGRGAGLGRAPSSRAPKISWNEGSPRP